MRRCVSCRGGSGSDHVYDIGRKGTRPEEPVTDAYLSPMALPRWIRPLGLVEHVVAGAVLTALLWVLGTPAVARIVAVAAVGVAHELGDGDFTRAPGAPWNGVLDVLAFLPGPLLWWLLG